MRNQPLPIERSIDFESPSSNTKLERMKTSLKARGEVEKTKRDKSIDDLKITVKPHNDLEDDEGNRGGGCFSNQILREKIKQKNDLLSNSTAAIGLKLQERKLKINKHSR